ncbi:SprB repeat-containing protein, partial [Chitinophaga sp. CF118]|uniref:SprB repeat-containing protein n=1 Tax=Chitinophaga sp. CF118 TaxID=1884367 RepID=UPI0008F0176E
MKKILLFLSCILFSLAGVAQKGAPYVLRAHARITLPPGNNYTVILYRTDVSTTAKVKIFEKVNFSTSTTMVIDTNLYLTSPIIHIYSDVSSSGCGNKEYDFQIPGNSGTARSFNLGCGSNLVNFNIYNAGIIMIENADRTDPADNIYTVDETINFRNSYCGHQGCLGRSQFSLDGQVFANLPKYTDLTNNYAGRSIKDIFDADYVNFIGKPVYFRSAPSVNYYNASTGESDSSHYPTMAGEGSNVLVLYFYPTTPKPVAVTGASPLCSYSKSNSVTVRFDRDMVPGEVLKPISIYKFNSPTDSIIVDQTSTDITSLDANKSVTITGLRDMLPGDYSLTVEGKYGSVVEVNRTYYHFTITAPAPVTFSVQPVDATCFGGNNGSVTVTAAGGNSTYQYSKDNGTNWQAGNVFNGLIKGDYTILVKDGNGCLAAASQVATVGQPPTGISSNISVALDPKGYHTYDGSAGISVSGGASPYTYAWNNGESTATINGLGGGTFDVVATDLNGCTTSQSIRLVEPDSLVVGFTTTPISCKGDGDGALQADVTGGVGPYTYLWNTNKITRKITGLVTATYSVTITDANNNQAIDSIDLAEPDLLVLGLTPTNVTCYGVANGIVLSNTTGGTLPYQYTWSNGATTANVNNLPPGDYYLDIKDAHGCVTTADTTITQPDDLAATGVITTPTRYGSTDGGVVTTVGGGTLPYQYAWSNSTVAPDLSNVGDGSYNLTITDAHNCSLVRTFVLHEPDPLVLALQQQAPVLCHDSTQGQVYGYVTGGVRPYVYAWSNGAADSVAKKLLAGTYHLKVTDMSGVIAEADIKLTQPPALNTTFVLQEVGCNGEANGAATATVSGGVAPYLYSWSNGSVDTSIKNLEAGDYILKVTDANGCILNSTAAVIAPGALAIGESIKEPTCTGFQDAAITLLPSGGRLPYSYQWSTGSTNKDIQQLGAGTYTVQMKDSTGCLIGHTYTLIDPLPLTVSLGVDRTLCKGQVAVTDGTIPNGADYSWNSNNGYTAHTAVVGINEAGIYDITATDIDGCVAHDTVVIKTVDNVISAEFLASTQAFTGDTVIVANVSSPA